MNIIRTALLDADYKDVLDYSDSQGYTLPSVDERKVTSKMFKGLKHATGNNLVAIELLKIYATNINYGGSIPVNLGYNGINMTSIGNNQSTRVNTILQTIKQGFRTNGTDSYILENKNIDTYTSTNMFKYLYFFNAQFSGNAFNTLNDGSRGADFHGHSDFLRQGNLSFFTSLNGGANYNAFGEFNLQNGENFGYTTLRRSNTSRESFKNGVRLSFDASNLVLPASINDYSLAIFNNGSITYNNTNTSLAIKIKGISNLVDQALLHTAVTTYLSELAAL